VAGTGKRVNETSGSVKCGELLTNCRTKIFKKDFTQWD
jgi:hypothetical protein